MKKDIFLSMQLLSPEETQLHYRGILKYGEDYILEKKLDSVQLTEILHYAEIRFDEYSEEINNELEKDPAYDSWTEEQLQENFQEIASKHKFFIDSSYVIGLIEDYCEEQDTTDSNSEKKLTAPVIALFCRLVNDSNVIKKEDNEIVSAFCERICAKFNLPYTDRIRQNFNNSVTPTHKKKVREQILPKIDKSTSDLIYKYLDSKPSLKQNLYG